MATLRLQIVTPEARVFDGVASMVELPTSEGQIGVYPGHVPLVIALGEGEIRMQSPAGPASWVVLGGYVEIEAEMVNILALFASSENEKVQIEEACQRAKEALDLAEKEPADVIDDRLARLRVELSRKKHAPGGGPAAG